MKGCCRVSALTAGALLALSAGCALGPLALRASRLPYNDVIQATTQEQLLLNLVRLRYRESPMFLEVGSVSAQFVFDQSAEMRGTLNENVPFEPINPDVLQLGGGVGYGEKPTITFAPLQGKEFFNRLMSPLSLETILLLTRSGWRVDRVLRLAAQGMNGLDNASGASGPTPDHAPRYERFARVCRLLRELQRQGLLELGYDTREVVLSEPLPAYRLDSHDLIGAARAGYRFRRAADGRGYVLTGTRQVPVWRVSRALSASPQLAELRELLGLAADQQEFELRLAAMQRPPPPGRAAARTAIDISTRSLLGTLFYLSQVVEIPASHRARGVVTTTRSAGGRPFDWTQVLGDLLRVHVQATRPANAAVAVYHRGYWFYIADDDLSSKSTFGLLGQLFALQAGGAKGVAPVLTLPVGG